MAIDLQIEGLSKRFGDLELFSGISFTVEERKRIGLIARNGKGKSTLLKIVAGDEPADEGKITLRNGLRVGYLEQEPDFDGNLTVIEACLQRNSEKAQLIARYEQAMQAGFSTAPDNIRTLGFGAGMGLPNMKKYSDEMDIQTEIGVGTTVTMKVYIQ